jgi:preprotein translocase subunit Sec63
MIRSCLIVLSENEQKRYLMVEVTPEALMEAAELLGIGGRASFNEIRQAYHEQIRKWHPDVSTQDPAVSHDTTIRVKMAYTLLVDYCMNHTFSFKASSEYSNHLSLRISFAGSDEVNVPYSF